jgi:hypothetical protein
VRGESGAHRKDSAQSGPGAHDASSAWDEAQGAQQTDGSRGDTNPEEYEEKKERHRNARHTTAREKKRAKKKKCSRIAVLRRCSMQQIALALLKEPLVRTGLLRWIVSVLWSMRRIAGCDRLRVDVEGRLGSPYTTGIVSGAVCSLQHACGMNEQGAFCIRFTPLFTTTRWSGSLSLGMYTSLCRLSVPLLVALWTFPYRYVFFTILRYIEHRRAACFEEQTQQEEEREEEQYQHDPATS